jgi:hypothetical protein
MDSLVRGKALAFALWRAAQQRAERANLGVSLRFAWRTAPELEAVICPAATLSLGYTKSCLLRIGLILKKMPWNEPRKERMAIASFDSRSIVTTLASQGKHSQAMVATPGRPEGR